jgi:hypothetical protein
VLVSQGLCGLLHSAAAARLPTVLHRRQHASSSELEAGVARSVPMALPHSGMGCSAVSTAASASQLPSSRHHTSSGLAQNGRGQQNAVQPANWACLISRWTAIRTHIQPAEQQDFHTAPQQQTPARACHNHAYQARPKARTVSQHPAAVSCKLLLLQCVQQGSISQSRAAQRAL